MQLYIIVTGLPASGKTTIGHLVAAAMNLPMLDKDEILESLFNSRGIGNAAWRKELSRAADKMLQEMAFQSGSAVITSWWHHPRSHIDTGTPVDWLSNLSGMRIELYCVCRPDVAAGR